MLFINVQPLCEDQIIQQAKEGPFHKTRMSLKMCQTTLDKTVADDIITVEEIDSLTQHILEEFLQDLNPTKDMHNKIGDRVVMPGVIRHTSYPSQPLAYYYITK